MNHVKNICECGKVINQCDCISPHIIVLRSPCTHVTYAETKSEPISLEALVKAKNKLESEKGELANLFRCHASVYSAIRNYFDKKQVEELIEDVKKKPDSYLGQIFGVDIFIDKDMKPGEWRFERRFYE